MAPEIHKECPYDVQVDIWSFGMLMYELFSWKLPYHNTPVLDVKEKVLAGHVPDTNGLSENFGVFKELYENCIKHNPTERWTADQCLDFLNKIS
uniref:Protein kinase domain-containing protein n=1 Tax=Arcella intermedia TaxID=1963864 RepID=A0A6B2LVX4_9EUKA